MAKAIKRHGGKVEHFVHGGEFKKMLDDADMTHEDAAIVFNVTSTTIRNWLRTGPEGTAAHFIGYMLAMSVPPGHVAGRLALAVSSVRRSSTKAGERSKMIAVTRVKNKVEELSIRFRVLKFLFEELDGTPQAIMAGLGCYSEIVELQELLEKLCDEEVIERKAGLYSLAPFERLKMQTAKNGSQRA